MSVRCAQCGEEAAEGARFCSACGAPLALAAGAERKLATIVFADIVGSTKLVAGRDPEDVRRTLEPFIATARRTFEEHGGRVEKYIGDAVMAAFGVPVAHGDDPDRAVAAALVLVDRVAAEEELELRIGVETGEVLVTSRDGDLALAGEPTHAAARLQQAAAPGEVLVGPRAAAAVRAAVLRDRREVEAAGFPAPLEAWRAARGDARPPAVAAGQQDEVALLGRGAELETLRLAYLRTVRERRPRLVLITGDAGTGKTRLARELIRTVEGGENPPLLLPGRNPPYGDGIAFWALGEQLRAAAGAPYDAGADHVRSALAQRLTELGAPQPEETAATLASTLAGSEAQGEGGAVRRAWRRLIAALAEEQPLLIAIDDVHWADDGYLDLVEDAAELPAQPVLVVCTARPEIDERRPRLADGSFRQRLELGPLPQPAAEELAAALVAGDDLDLAREIAATAGGNPFFTEEIARSIHGDGPGGHSLPDTVQAAIASRLDSLPVPAKRAIQYAAVLGDRFRTEALRELLGEDPEPMLAELEERALIEQRGEDGLRSFHHQLIRDVAYASLTRAERVDLHARAAASLAARAGERYAELVEVVAWHLGRAAELDPSPERRAAAYETTVDAASHAAKRGATARAEQLYEQAAGFAASDTDRVGILAEAAQLALSRLRGDEAYRLRLAAAEAAERAGETRDAASLFASAVEGASRMMGISGRFPEEELTGVLARAERLARDPDPHLRAQLLLDHAWIEWTFGRIDGRLEGVEEALGLAREAGDPLLLSSALDAATSESWSRGRFAEAANLNRERIDVLAAAPPSAAVAAERTDALYMLTQSLTRAGRLREALEWDSINASEIADSAPHIAWAHAIPALYHLGEWDAALERGAEMRSNWIAEGRPPFAPFSPCIATIGAIHAIRGDEPASRDWLDLAFEVAGETQQLPGVALIAADAAVHAGDLDGAVALLRDPDATFLFWWGDPLLARRAEVLARAGAPGAEEALAVAEARDLDDPFTNAVTLRARAALTGDEEPLRGALELLDEAEYVYAAAYTRWLLGGEEREAARETFARLGAVEPG